MADVELIRPEPQQVPEPALMGETVRRVPPEFGLFFCPLILGNFYRTVLKSGHRLRKVMSYMTLGPYTLPNGIWLPSIGY